MFHGSKKIVPQNNYKFFKSEKNYDNINTIIIYVNYQTNHSNLTAQECQEHAGLNSFTDKS